MELLPLTIMELLSLVLSLSILVQVALSGTFIFQNNCPYTVWPATYSSTAQLLQAAFELPTRGFSTWGLHPMHHGCLREILLPLDDCGSGQVACNGAGGAQPTTLAEFTLSGSADTQNFYDTSNIDGFNVPISITPVGGLGDIKVDCNTTSCAAGINSSCRTRPPTDRRRVQERLSGIRVT